MLRGLIPYNWVRTYDEYAVYAPFVLLAFMMVPRIGVIVPQPTCCRRNWSERSMACSALGL